MFRQSPRRNGRNKGLKIKHVLQISLLLGVSVWLLYQVHHSDDNKSSLTTNILNKLQNDGSKGLFKLGRKDLRPKDKETHAQDTKETEDEEESNENGVEEFVHDHDSEEGEDMKHEQVEENENTDNGEDSQEKESDEEAEEKENGEKGREQSGVKNENIQKQNIQHEGKHSEDGVVINEDNRSTKRGEKEQVNRRNEKGNTNESKKESILLRSNKGKKEEMREVHKSNANEKRSEEERERKDDKQSDEGEEIEGKVNENKSNDQNKVVVMEKAEKEGGKKMNPNMKEVGILGPSDDGDQSVINESHKGKDVNNNKNGNKGPSMDQSRSASNQSHSKTNEPNKASDASTNAATTSEKESQGDVTSITKFDENQNKVENPLTQIVLKEQTTQLISSGNENTSPYSDSLPSIEPKNSKSVKRNSTVSGNEKSDSEPEAEAEEKESNGNVLNDEESESSGNLSILEEEKEVLPDLETLPDSGTGGSITHENAATE